MITFERQAMKLAANGGHLIMKKSTLLMGAALLGATASITPANVNAATSTTQAASQKQTQSSKIAASGVLKVATGKSVQVYSAPDSTTAIKGKVLTSGTSWRYFAQENAGGLLWINLGGNQWVNSSDASAFSLSKTVSVSSTTSKNTSTKTTSNAPAGIVAPGKVAIAAGHTIPVYTSPSADTPTGKTLAGGTSWKMFTQVTYRGYLWINLGGNQWINDEDAAALTLSYTGKKSTGTSTTATSKPATTTSTTSDKSVSGTIRINYVPGYGIAVWTAPNSGVTIPGKKLNDGTNWRVFKTETVNGSTWYNLGGNQWVDGHYATYTAAGKTATKKVAQSGTITTNSKARTNIYSNPTNGKVTRSVGKNVKLKYYKTENNGILWYYIGANEWVRAIDVK